MSKNQYSAIYGGSFDPPHAGHAHVLNCLLSSGLASQVIIVPASDSRYDKPPHSSFNDRFAMLKLFCSDLFPTAPVTVSDLQQKVPALTKGYALDTVEYLQSKNPQEPLAWVIGEDNLSSLGSWYKADVLFNKVTFLVVSRPGSNAIDNLLELQVKVQGISTLTESPVSSSEVRRKIKLREPIFSLVSPSVLSYIASSKLYLDR